MSYWDTSALLKLYVAEPDSGVFLAFAAGTPKLATAFIGKHEARAAFRRREAEQVLSPGGGEACYQKLIHDITLGRLELVPESTPLEDEFGRILAKCLSQSPPILVRTNDALHLAAAKVAGETEFLSTDGRQRATATFLGFTVLPAVP